MDAARAPHQSMRIPVAGVVLEADIVVPDPAWGQVVFVHGSGSSRRSPRNRTVAEQLQRSGLGTILVDLLTVEEERIDGYTREFRFDIDLLAARVTALTDWLASQPLLAGLGIGLFGASTGAAAALVAAAARPDTVRAVVSRGGRTDLAGDRLAAVQQPTLLIVGERDSLLVELNRRAMEQLPGERRFVIVRGASHLFEEAGMLEQVAALARDWFLDHLKPAAR
jgi:putative phosphoribosyl transferase